MAASISLSLRSSLFRPLTRRAFSSLSRPDLCSCRCFPRKAHLTSRSTPTFSNGCHDITASDRHRFPRPQTAIQNGLTYRRPAHEQRREWVSRILVLSFFFPFLFSCRCFPCWAHELRIRTFPPIAPVFLLRSFPMFALAPHCGRSFPFPQHSARTYPVAYIYLRGRSCCHSP